MTPLTFAYASRPNLDAYLDEWRAKYNVELRQETWATLWDSLRDSIFARRGIEVSEIGTTWLTRLVGMNAIRPFEPQEVQYIAGRDAFSPAIWQNSQIEGDKRIWSIPLTLDARVIYYWPDMLETAGLDGKTAFQSPEQLQVTLDALCSQAETPWGVTTHLDTLNVQYIATWVWKAGGDFVTADGRKTCFTEPKALQAIEQFYKLYAYMPQQAAPIHTDQLINLFIQRRIAAVMSGPWFTERLRSHLHGSPALAQIRTTLPPGPTFLGGTNLVMLSHTPASSERSAIELIKRLVSRSTQEQFYDSFGMLPVRSDVISNVLASDDPLSSCYMNASLYGRSYPSVVRWGLIEERLVEDFAAIWVDIQTSQRPAKDIIHERLERAAQSLDLVLAQ
ncbi:MAG: extracellular solute-binding protein [Chloroflexota bacterium]